MAHPFRDPKAMELLLSRIEESWKKDPRPMLFLYLVPVFASLVDKVPIFERIPSPPQYAIVMYRTPPASRAVSSHAGG